MPVSDRHTDKIVIMKLFKLLCTIHCWFWLVKADTASRPYSLRFHFYLWDILKNNFILDYFFNLQERNNITVYQQLYLCE